MKTIIMLSDMQLVLGLNALFITNLKVASTVLCVSATEH